MTVTVTLDWLAFTQQEMTHEYQRFVADYASAETIKDVTPRNGYSSAIEDGNGVVRMWNLDREEMGWHVIFSGSALRNVFRNTGISQRGLVASVLGTGGRVSRLDLAKDIEGNAIDLQRIFNAIEKGENEGTARTYSQLKSHDGGITIYVGSRQSEKFIRVYDKAIEQGMHNEEWKRFELETKGMVSRALASILLASDKWGGAFDDMALGMVSLPTSKDFQAFFPAGEALVGIPKLEKKTDREAWIQSQVIKAVLGHYREHPDSPAIALLRQALDFADRK